MASSPIVTVNLWFDRPVLDVPFVGLPGRAMQWVFDKSAVFGDGASHLSLVSSGASPLVDQTNDALIAAAHQELLEALPGIRPARLLRATVIREPKATFSLAPGQPSRPESRTPVRGLFLAGDWLDTGLPATIESAVRAGHRAAEVLPCVTIRFMTSIVIHYKELMLKGRNRPWFVKILVRNLRTALADLDIRSIRSVMGRIEIDLGAARPGNRFANGCGTSSASRIFPTRPGRHTSFRRLPPRFSMIWAIAPRPRSVCPRGAPTNACRSRRRRSNAKWAASSRRRKAGMSISMMPS